ncbi:hypothetical protein DSL72_002729 [Monilinia vaccinii-corymbosi]|uniref:Uncharacterized protein n=1 Tax=Monilinia vaccinii-corymbosi TaxID=61207 RepID=A0A8A3PDJ4_9HELO|nr:hypothetical protein DSL72_002729 [Monilinia vaccinii-corymbosi]
MSSSQIPSATTSARRPAVAEPDSEFKKKYGPQPGRPNDKHSGLTPILPFISKTGIAISSRSILRREEKQRSMFRGFTAKELLDLDANITNSRPLKPSDLDSPIHPCFKRSRWLQRGPGHDPHSLGTLGPGRWVASNDRVWKILQPTLRLVSLLLENINKDFYDSILRGPRTPIDPDRFPDNPPACATQEALHTLRSYKSRGLPPQDPALQQSRDDLLKGLTEYVSFRFREKSDILVYNGCTALGIYTDTNGNRSPRALITLDQRNYEPLLRKNITTSERLSYQWRTAITITHECSHAMQGLAEYYRAKESNTLDDWRTKEEPYFENHCIQETGFLMEQFSLGGVIRGETNPKGSLFPTIAFFWTEWPSTYWANYGTNLILKTPPLDPEYNFYPIPVTHFEDVHQLHFWNHAIKAFGAHMLGLRSLRVRMRYSDFSVQTKTIDVVAGQLDGSNWKSKHDALKLKQNMSADERRACSAGDKLIEGAKLSEQYFFNSKKQEEELQSILEFNVNLKERLQAAAMTAFSAAVAPGQQSTNVDPRAVVEESMQDQYGLIFTAAKAHCAAVDSYFALANSGKAPLEVQKHLLLFNQSFRGFAREIAHRSWTDELIEDYQYIDEMLEFRRQMLYSPDDIDSREFSVEYAEFGELDLIIQAYRILGTDPHKIKSDILQMTDVLESRWGSSRYARTCAKIMRLAADITTGEAGIPEDTIQDIDTKIQALVSLRNGEDGKSCLGWKKTLENMIQQMQDIVEEIRKKFALSDSDDTDEDDYDPRDEDDIPTDNEMEDAIDQPAC